MKNTLPKLYDLISKLIIALEDEFALLHTKKIKNASATRKNIADNLHRLVSLIVQLNKISNLTTSNVVSQSDQEIIEHFLQKYCKEQFEK